MGEIYVSDAVMQKFNLKNKEKFELLNDFIDVESSDIKSIVASTEMFDYLMASEHADVSNLINGEFDYDSSTLKYKGKRVIRDIYVPAGGVYFTSKSTAIKFDVPCICGIYNDEQHP